MSEFQTAYIPVGVPTFHLESAQIEFEKSVGLLSALTEHVVYPDKMLLTVEDLSVYLETIHPDLLILQNLTFANAAYACECMKRFTCPVLLWTLREPVIDGGRLRLNSLTSAYSAANAMMLLGKENFEYVFGSPEEERVKEKVAACIRAAELKTFLKELRMAAIGHPPPGIWIRARAGYGDAEGIWGDIGSDRDPGGDKSCQGIYRGRMPAVPGAAEGLYYRTLCHTKGESDRICPAFQGIQ